MHRHSMPDVFEIPGDAGEKGPFRWVAACAVGAIVIGAAMVLVAASEDRNNAAPQVTVSH